MSDNITYQTALAWGDINDKDWKIIGQFFIPSDPNGAGCWVYFPPSATDVEVNRQRQTGHLLTTVCRYDGQLCLLARRPKKKVDDAEFGPRGFKHSASWF